MHMKKRAAQAEPCLPDFVLETEAEPCCFLPSAVRSTQAASARPGATRAFYDMSTLAPVSVA